MDVWLSLIKDLIWPLFWAIALFAARKPLLRLARAVEDRIVAGAEFEAGAGGIRVGPAPKLADVTSIVARTETLTEATAIGGGEIPKTLADVEAPTPRNIYLVHSARRDPSIDKNNLEHYRVRVYLDADDVSILDEVSKLTYYLHPTFKNPIRVTQDRDMSFELRTIVWGEFNVAAKVQFKDGHEEELERYLNL